MRSSILSALSVSSVAALALEPAIQARSSSNDGLSRCTASTFQYPSVFGVKILNVTAAPLYNYTFLDLPTETFYVADPVCQVNVTYTHPGYNDTVNVYHWLPLEGWNGRLFSIGGSGYAGTLPVSTGKIAFENKFAAAGSDTGHPLDAGTSPAPWALSSDGNINWNVLETWASKSLDEMPQIAKQIIKNYYGQGPSFSYFAGCSGGGRQGMQIGERFPDHYDGIASNCPAHNWSRFIPIIYWPQLVMQEEGYYPTNCELDAFSAAAVTACDGIDGVIDGVIGNPELCKYNATSLVGQTATCSDNSTVPITKQAADVVNQIWTGPVDIDGQFIWYTWDISAQLTITANITIAPNGTRSGNPQVLGSSWFQYMVKKDPSFDVATLNYSTFGQLVLQGYDQYKSVIDATYTDLSRLKRSGHKMITWQGSIDQYIPVKGTIDYYKQAKACQPDIEDYYRLFIAQGSSHCTFNPIGSAGYFPVDYFDKLQAWVENGTTPDALSGVNILNGREQPICPWPQVAKWNGSGNSSLATSYTCADSY